MRDEKTIQWGSEATLILSSEVWKKMWDEERESIVKQLETTRPDYEATEALLSELRAIDRLRRRMARYVTSGTIAEMQA